MNNISSYSPTLIVRSKILAAAERPWQRLKKCLEGASLATGCEVHCHPLNSDADLRSSVTLCKAFADVMPVESVSLEEPPDFLAGSTDMGNVTYECPGFHGAFVINTVWGQGNHTKGFANAAGLEESFRSTVKWGKGMAQVRWRIIRDDELMMRLENAGRRI